VSQAKQALNALRMSADVKIIGIGHAMCDITAELNSVAWLQFKEAFPALLSKG